ncbi:MAG TPA: hypothetical protein TECP_01361 [Hyphomicrobiaceae bacterium MAG_BT-2024]
MQSTAAATLKASMKSLSSLTALNGFVVTFTTAIASALTANSLTVSTCRKRPELIAFNLDSLKAEYYSRFCNKRFVSPSFHLLQKFILFGHARKRNFGAHIACRCFGIKAKCYCLRTKSLVQHVHSS